MGEVVLKHLPVFRSSFILQRYHPWDPTYQLPEKTEVCSPPRASPVLLSLQATSILLSHLPSALPCLSGTSRRTWSLVCASKKLCYEVVPKRPGVFISCSIAHPADERKTKVSEKREGLQSGDLLELFEGDVVYSLTLQWAVAHSHHNITFTGLSSEPDKQGLTQPVTPYIGEVLSISSARAPSPPLLCLSFLDCLYLPTTASFATI